MEARPAATRAAIRAELAADPVAVAPPVPEPSEPVERAPASVVAQEGGVAAAGERVDAAGVREQRAEPAAVQEEPGV